MLGFCVFHYLLRILPSFLPFYLFPFLSSSLPLPCFMSLLLLPSRLPSLPPSYFPPSLFSSLSPADVLFPETSSNSSRDSSLFARYYQVVVFQLIERSLLPALHRLSACELGFVFVEFYFTHSSSCRCHFFFYSETVAGSFSPFLESQRKKSPQFSVLFYPRFETLKLVKEK